MALSGKYQLKNRFLLALFCSVLPVFIHLSIDFGLVYISLALSSNSRIYIYGRRLCCRF